MGQIIPQCFGHKNDEGGLWIYQQNSKTNLVVFYWNLDEQPPARPSKLTLDNVV